MRTDFVLVAVEQAQYKRRPTGRDGLIPHPDRGPQYISSTTPRDVRFSATFKGLLPFVVTDILRLLLLIDFPGDRPVPAFPMR